MKYFFDTEFIEGPQDKTIAGIKYGQTKPTIDLISIGIVSESGKEYYAVSKDFNLKEAWNRYQVNQEAYYYGMGGKYIPEEGEYWIRENVLRPIFRELAHEDAMKDFPEISEVEKGEYFENRELPEFTYKNLKKLLSVYGKTNKQIAKEIKDFIYTEKISSGGQITNGSFFPNEYPEPEFWAYYADYDWVVFCQLFGTMMDLPKGFPMYCRDLKQLYDSLEVDGIYDYPFHITTLKDHPEYPKQENEHNAIDDARWGKRLYKFLTKL